LTVPKRFGTFPKNWTRRALAYGVRAQAGSFQDDSLTPLVHASGAAVSPQGAGRPGPAAQEARAAPNEASARASQSRPMLRWALLGLLETQGLAGLRLAAKQPHQMRE